MNIHHISKGDVVARCSTRIRIHTGDIELMTLVAMIRMTGAQL